MPISEQQPPRDTGGKVLSALEITKRKIYERIPDIFKTEKMREEHKKLRTLDLARHMHKFGAASLPLPNFAAFTEIQRLEYSDDNPFEYIAECIFILSNQQNEDNLFLTGIERRKAIIEACKNIHAHNAVEYLVCIREMLEEIKKKHISSEATMRKETASLIQQISSSLSAKPSDSPLVTS